MGKIHTEPLVNKCVSGLNCNASLLVTRSFEPETLLSIFADKEIIHIFWNNNHEYVVVLVKRALEASFLSLETSIKRII